MIAQLNSNYIRLSYYNTIKRLIGYVLFEGRPVTTKGQWINPFIFALFHLIKNLPQLKRVKNPVFIVGTGRSGTTVLGTIMSIHNQVGFLNEPKALWHSIIPKEDVIGSYSQNDGFFRLCAKDASESVRISAHQIYGAYLLMTRSKRIVDKYPELIFRVSFIKEIFPDAKFIFIVRNGWDTCYSIKKWSENNRVEGARETHDWWGVNRRKWKLLNKQIVGKEDDFKEIAHKVAGFRDHINMAMVEWIVTMREGLQQMKNNADSFLLVKYEDLTLKPRKTLQEILKFCHLPNDNKMFQYADKIIKLKKPHPHLEIDPLIHPLVNKISHELGY
jgi:hypothetical protein